MPFWAGNKISVDCGQVPTQGVPSSKISKGRNPMGAVTDGKGILTQVLSGLAEANLRSPHTHTQTCGHRAGAHAHAYIHG